MWNHIRKRTFCQRGVCKSYCSHLYNSCPTSAVSQPLTLTTKKRTLMKVTIFCLLLSFLTKVQWEASSQRWHVMQGAVWLYPLNPKWPRGILFQQVQHNLCTCLWVAQLCKSQTGPPAQCSYRVMGGIRWRWRWRQSADRNPSEICSLHLPETVFFPRVPENMTHCDWWTLPVVKVASSSSSRYAPQNFYTCKTCGQ